MSQLRLAMVLAMTVAIAPFALDTYLPAFPALADYLGVGIHAVALSLSVYLGALSLGQLVGGPLSDRYGRQPVMLIGLTTFALSSFLISQIDSLNQLLVLRAFQAFGGGWVIVCVPALVRDRVRGVAAAKLFSLIGLIVVAAPAIAPAVGSLLLGWYGWGSIFIFLGSYALCALVVLKATVFSRRAQRAPTPEGPEGQGTLRVSALRRYLRVLRTPAALRFIILQASIFSVMMLFITHSSFIYQVHFGVSADGFAALFAANIVLMWVIMMVNRWLLNYFQPFTILRGAVTLQGFGIASLLLITQLLPVLWLFVPAMMFAIGSIGATSPNCQACYMEHFAENGGTAAALMGAAQFGIAGTVSAASALLPETIQMIVLAQGGCSLLAILLVWWPRNAETVPLE